MRQSAATQQRLPALLSHAGPLVLERIYGAASYALWSRTLCSHAPASRPGSSLPSSARGAAL